MSILVSILTLSIKELFKYIHVSMEDIEEGYISACRIFGAGIGTLIVAVAYQPLFLMGGYA